MFSYNKSPSCCFLGLKPFSYSVFIFRQNHSSAQLPSCSRVSLPASPLSRHPSHSLSGFTDHPCSLRLLSLLSLSPHMCSSPHWPCQALPTPSALTHCQSLSLYTTSAGRLSLTLASSPLRGAYYALSKFLLSHSLSLGTVDILDWMTRLWGLSCVWVCHATCLASAHKRPVSLPPVMTTKNIPKVPWEQKHPHLRTTVPDSSAGRDCLMHNPIPKLARSRSPLIICCMNEQKFLL